MRKLIKLCYKLHLSANFLVLFKKVLLWHDQHLPVLGNAVVCSLRDKIKTGCTFVVGYKLLFFFFLSLWPLRCVFIALRDYFVWTQAKARPLVKW